jgi:DNA repair ATPase RecN
VTEQMVDKTQELDRLRARQEELERERKLLEEMRKKQEAFDTGRRELKSRLNESLVRMEKDRLKAERLVQLLEETRRLFRERLDEVTALREEEWADENLLDELNQALVLLDNVRSDYNQSMAKVEANQSQTAAGARPLAFAEPDGAEPAGAQGFGYWLRAGVAFTLPLMVWLAVLAGVWMVLFFLI